MLPWIKETARQCGYAIGTHGSQRRDLDLIAAPWTNEAVSAMELTEAIVEALKAAFPDNPFIYWIDDNGSGKWPSVSFKPHGRLAFTVITGRGREGWAEFIDLSIMPKASHE